MAYQYLECIQALCDSTPLLEEPELYITLEQLSDCYGVHYDDEISSKLLVTADVLLVWAWHYFKHRFVLLLWAKLQVKGCMQAVLTHFTLCLCMYLCTWLQLCAIAESSFARCLPSVIHTKYTAV